MSLRTSATRYAKALLEVAIRESDPAQIERQLADIVGAMSEHRELRRVLTNPAVPQHARVGVVRALVDRAGAEPPLAKLLAMLAERGRLELLPDLLDVYRERLLAHGNVVRAAITAAAPLAEDKVKALEQRLGGLTGKQVRLTVDVDPSLLGGVVARIGSTVYDGSIRTQLQKIKQQLIETA
jgi:F-type H+-transporting ATPase subunit delta